MVMKAGDEPEKIHGASCHAATGPDKQAPAPRTTVPPVEAGLPAKRPCIALAAAFAGKPSSYSGRCRQRW